MSNLVSFINISYLRLPSEAQALNSFLTMLIMKYIFSARAVVITHVRVLLHVYLLLER